MSKSRRTETSRKAERQENPLLEAVVAARSDLRALVMDAGFGVLGSLLEEDRAELCGERYARSQQRRAYRHGYDEGSLVMGGRRVKVRKPRARSVDGQELPLPHWERFKATDPLEERAVEQILCGVTTRKYERSLERLDDGRASSGTSRSSVSRRFVARTAKQVQQYLAQPLNEVDLPVLVIDGTHMGKHLLVDRHGHRRGRRQACAGCRRGHHGELPRVPVAAAAVDRARHARRTGAVGGNRWLQGPP